MERTIRIGRREFTRESLLAALSGVVVTVTACGGGGGGSSSGSPTAPTRSSGQGTVLANHGHSAFISDAQLAAGNAVQLNIQGSADHPHTLLVSAQGIQAIVAGSSVGVDSTTDPSPSAGSHGHRVTFNAAPGEPPAYEF